MLSISPFVMGVVEIAGAANAANAASRVSAERGRGKSGAAGIS